ncbi:hypothetical protein EMIT0215P_90113 [Pseudomonas serboccidentalis]
MNGRRVITPAYRAYTVKQNSYTYKKHQVANILHPMEFFEKHGYRHGRVMLLREYPLETWA